MAPVSGPYSRKPLNTWKVGRWQRACAAAVPPATKRLFADEHSRLFPGVSVLSFENPTLEAPVTVVAPATDRSGSSGALSLNVYLRATRSEFSCGGTTGEAWAVTGMPSDSVLFGLSAVLGDVPPDLVISGMNSGQNVGRAVNHSGTVGAAVTAAEEGVPAMAVSISIHMRDASTVFSQTGAATPPVIQKRPSTFSFNIPSRGWV